MFEGTVEAIFIGSKKQEKLERIEQVEAVAGRGLVGDRYGLQAGTFSKPNHVDREVTLIEAEAIEALAQEEDLRLAPGEARRNLVTRGVPLNHLVGKEFLVGDVRLKGIRLCEPCDHLQKLTMSGVKQGLMHRGGLRAQILRGGLLQTGAVIRPL